MHAVTNMLTLCVLRVGGRYSCRRYAMEYCEQEKHGRVWHIIHGAYCESTTNRDLGFCWALPGVPAGGN